MSNNEQAILLILIFVIPVLGMLIDSLKPRQLITGNKHKIWGLGLSVFFTFLLVLNFLISGSDAGAKFTIKNVFLGFDSETGFTISPFNAICAFAFSLAVLFYQIIFSNFRKELATNSVSQNIAKQFEDKTSALCWVIAITFFICIFAEGNLIFAFGLAGFSILNFLFSKLNSDKRVNIFAGNIISDFILILVLLVFYKEFTALSEFLKVFIGLFTIIAILYKCSLPPFCWHKNYQVKDEKNLFISIIRLSLIFILFQRFNQVILTSKITLIILILLLTVIIIKGLIQLLISKNLNSIFENSCIFASAIFIFVCCSTQQETTFLAFTSVVFSILLLMLSISLIASSNARILKSEEEANINKFGHLGGLSNKLPVIFLFFVISSFSIAGIVPLSSGWATFSFTFDSETFTGSSSMFLHNLISFEIAISGLIFILIFAGFTKLIFLGKFRGKSHKLVDITPPGKKFITPGIIFSIILLTGGVIYLPDNSGFSQLLPVFLGEVKNNGLTLSFITSLGLSRFAIIAIHFVLVIAIWLVATLLIKNLNLRILVKIKRKFRNLINVEPKLITVNARIKLFYQQLSEIYYILVERILFDYFFWFAGALIYQFSKKLSVRFKTENQDADLNYIFWGILLLFALTILLIII